MKIAVVGAGISGLTAAFRLTQASKNAGAGHDVTVYEAADRPGGKLRSARVDGFLVEWAANGVLSGRTHVFDLARDVGLTPIDASPLAHHRYLFDGETLRALPTSPPGFLSSNLLSVVGRMRAMGEPLVARGDGAEETVYDFLKRRFGKALAETFADLAVLGIYAGDPHQLSVDAAFPLLREIEREYGSVIKGMIARKKAGKSLGRLACFKEGMGALVEALAARVDVRLNTRIDDLNDLDADHVIIATPPPQAATLLARTAPVAAEALRQIPVVPIAAVMYGAPVDALPRALDGFGCLIPPSAGRKIIGVVWTSAVFPTHVPEGQAALRVLVGGARQGDLVDLPDDEMIALVRAELSVVMGGPMPAPTVARVVRWPAGIPQYTLGHGDRVQRIEGALPPHISLASNGLYGASVSDCVARGEALAASISSPA
ncbi:MAG: oxygen-dependent protoporphyrinogen oxidase [Bradymonadia bacterium]